LGDARIGQASPGSGDDFRRSGAVGDRRRDLGRPRSNRRPGGESRSFLSSELCHLSAHSLHQSSHLRHRPSQIRWSPGNPHLPISPAYACLGRKGRGFEESFGHAPRRPEHFRGTFGVAFGKARCGEQQFGVGNEAAQCPQVCSVWHKFKSKRTWIGRERGQKQTCLFCYA
jgi:hypothetical protein